MIVTEKMREAGSKIASDLIEAAVCKNMGGLGGAKSWNEFKAYHSDNENMDLIRQYVNDEIDSVTAIYIAMDRAKN